MLRRIPYTLLVCLVLLASLCFVSTSWAVNPDDSLDVLLKPNNSNLAANPVVHQTKSAKRSNFGFPAPWTGNPYVQGPSTIRKVQAPPPMFFPAAAPMIGCFLPTPRVGQWQIGVQAIFANIRAQVQWPPNFANWFGGWGYQDWTDFANNLGLPAHQVIPEVNAKYQFRCNWALQYTGLGTEIKGGKWVDNWFIFGFQGGGGSPQLWSPGQQVQSRWQYSYQKVGLVYDAVKNCKASISLFGGWAHADSRIDANCFNCGNWQSTLSKSIDTAAVGLELQKCMTTAPNGGTFSCEAKAVGMFGDDAAGVDVQVGGRYSIPVNCGRWGYMKGGYRLIDLKKSQNDFAIKTALDGGFVEMGFIF